MSYCDSRPRVEANAKSKDLQFIEIGLSVDMNGYR